MLTDFTEAVWIVVGDDILIVALFTLAGALILSIVQAVSIRTHRWQ